MSNHHHSLEAAFLAFTAAELGAAPESIAPGQSRRFSTNGKRSDTAGACLMFPDGLGGICTDFRQGITRVWSAIDPRQMTPNGRRLHRLDVARALIGREKMQIAEWQANLQDMRSCLDESVPLHMNDPVTKYFARRGILGTLPARLLMHPRLRYYGEQFVGCYPAMIAPLVTASGQMMALHRTYLTPSGEKAPVATPKKLSRTAGPLDGTYIPLHAPLGGVLGIGEGIETSQAAHLLFGVPMVAAYCADNLSKFVWPPGLRQLFIFADHDEAGLRAARALEQRAQRAGLKTTVMTPSVPGEDWCDVLQRTPKLGKETRQ